MDQIDYDAEFKPFPYFPPLAVEGLFLMTVHDVETDLMNYGRHAKMVNKFEGSYPTTDFSYMEAYQKVVHPKIPEDFQSLERPEGAVCFWRHIHNLALGAQSPTDSSATETPIITSRQLCTRQCLQSQIPELSAPAGTYAQLHHHTSAPAAGRVFFVSTIGFMGLCPINTLPGDNIYIFLGGATPFVVRTLDSGIVRFVGESLVLGVMHGEAMEQRPQERTMLFLQ